MPIAGVAALRDAYDVVVVGAGAGGGVTARVLAEAGLRVLLVERARAPHAGRAAGDHLHGKRRSSTTRSPGPGPGHPRVLGRRSASSTSRPTPGRGA